MSSGSGAVTAARRRGGSWSVDIDADACKGCKLCVAECRHDVLQMSSTRNRKGYLVVEVRAISRCVGCRLCEWICPEMAIAVVPTSLSGEAVPQ